MHEEFWRLRVFLNKMIPVSTLKIVFVYKLIPSNTMARKKQVLLLQAYQMGGAIICHYS